jgi:hypothetical protein
METGMKILQELERLAELQAKLEKLLEKVKASR